MQSIFIFYFLIGAVMSCMTSPDMDLYDLSTPEMPNETTEDDEMTDTTTEEMHGTSMGETVAQTTGIVE